MDEEKKIDETWKEATEREKKAQKEKGEFVPPEPDFNFFVTTLAIQASISMGVLENPSTGKKEESLPQAKFIIDTLSMLKDKTKGNLNAEEDAFLEKMLYELRTQYVAKLPKGEL